MAELTVPDGSDYLADFRIGVDFIVGARHMAEARALVDQMLAAEDSDGTSFVTGRHRTIDDGRSWGVSSWAPTPPRPSQAALVQARYPALAGNIAIVDILRELVGADDRGVQIDHLIPEDTRGRIQVMLDEVNPVVRVEDPDDSRRLLFEGAALESANHLSEGVYRAFDYDDREFVLVVAPSDLTPSERVSAALPRDLHDSRTLDEIAELLRDHDPNAPLPELVERINRRLETTHRGGLRPSASHLERQKHEPGSVPVHVGVITWSDEPHLSPTVAVGSSRQDITKQIALILDQELRSSSAFVGAAPFLESHAVLREDMSPDAIESWLADFSRSSPYPAWSVHEAHATATSPRPAPAARQQPVESAPLDEQQAHISRHVEEGNNLVLVDPGSQRLPGDTGDLSAAEAARESSSLLIGVIEWHESQGYEPTILASVDATEVTFAMATMIYEEMFTSSGIYEADAFLDARPDPDRWRSVRDAEQWLTDVDQELESPKFYYRDTHLTGSRIRSFHQGILDALREHPEWLSQRPAPASAASHESLNRLLASSTLDPESQARVSELLGQRAAEFDAIVHRGDLPGEASRALGRDETRHAR